MSFLASQAGGRFSAHRGATPGHFSVEQRREELGARGISSTEIVVIGPKKAA